MQSALIGNEKLASFFFLGGLLHNSINSTLNQKSEGPVSGNRIRPQSLGDQLLWTSRGRICLNRSRETVSRQALASLRNLEGLVSDANEPPQVETGLTAFRTLPFRVTRRVETEERPGISDWPRWSSSSKTRLAAPRAHTSSPQ
jgi:hypothetical protein